MEMTSQPSMSRLHSTENLSELSNRSEEESGEHESDVLTKIFTKEEEISLLKQITEAGKQSLCICKFCSMDRLKKLAYQVACEKKKLYPNSWKKDQQAESEWVKKFKEWHKDEISKLPSICKMTSSQSLTSGKQLLFKQIMTLEEERSLLADIETNITETDCICQKCVRQKVSYLAYIQASEKKIIYPESWNKNKKAGRKWLQGFAERHIDEISKFPFICKMISSQALTIREQSPFNQILPPEVERSLLADIETNKTETDCICQKCVRQKLPYLAYIQASDKKMIYPESWDRNKKAGENWQAGFIKRHSDQISKFPSICKIRSSRLSTSGLSLSAMKNVSKISNNSRKEVGKHKNNVPNEVFTQEEEILLLKQIKEEKQLFCICKSCSMNHLKKLAYQVACEKKKPYPQSWKKDQQTESEWVKKFEERHKDEISKFPFICKMTSSQSLTSGKQFIFYQILTLEEERSLLADIETNKIEADCICQKCVRQKLPYLAYIQASEKKKIYPESWNKNKKAGEKWLNGFAKRHKDQIDKFSSNCKIRLYQMSTSGLSLSSMENVSELSINTREEVGKHKNNVPNEVFTQEEEILLLKQIKEEKQLFCICKSCSMDYLKRLAYQVACEKKKPYPQSWKKDQQAESEWVKKFEERHKDEISKFPFICEMTLSQVLMSEEQSLFNENLTLEEEESLLAEMETSTS